MSSKEVNVGDTVDVWLKYPGQNGRVLPKVVLLAAGEHRIAVELQNETVMVDWTNIAELRKNHGEA